MKIASITHSENVLEDIRKIFKEEPQTFLFITKTVFEKLTQVKNIRLDKKRIVCVSHKNEKTTCFIKTSDDNKETDIILVNENTSNVYSVIYFKSLYTNKHIPIITDNLKAEKIILIE